MDKHKQLGLALGSGGPRGLAHIGVIRALVEADIPIDVVTGTSAGAIMGGLYVALRDIARVEQIFVDLKLTELAVMFSDVTFRSGLIKGDRLEQFLDKYLDDQKIEDLSSKFAAIATSIETAEEVIIDSGSLTKAIRASSSLPGLIDIFSGQNGYLIDGGVSQPVPIRPAKSLGADLVIAVNLDSYNYDAKDFAEKPGMTKIGTAALKLLRYSLSQELCREASVVITPDVGQFAWMNLTNKQDRIEIIKRGYEAARASLPAIRELL